VLVRMADFNSKRDENLSLIIEFVLYYRAKG
jgi:hypothetical protein